MNNSIRTHIIIVNYNAEGWLTRSIESALQFSTGNITVVDNASTDNSVQLAKQAYSDERLKWIENSQNLGFAVANNQVLNHLNAEYAVLMNPDCVLSRETLSTILQAFAKYPELGLASCKICNTDGSIQTTCRRRFPTPKSAFGRFLPNFLLRALIKKDPAWQDFNYGLEDSDNANEVEFVEAISGAFMVARQSAIAEVGVLDEGYFMHCEDLDWCKRFHLAGWKVGFLPNTAVTHAKGVSATSRPIRVLWTLHRGMRRFFKKYYFAQTSLPLRVLVNIGIVSSFCIRSIKTIIQKALP